MACFACRTIAGAQGARAGAHQSPSSLFGFFCADEMKIAPSAPELTNTAITLQTITGRKLINHP